VEQASRSFAEAHQRESDPVLEALLLKRVEVYTWLDSPAKQANLAAINRMIEEHQREKPRSPSEMASRTRR
jgi:hypothetical protein